MKVLSLLLAGFVVGYVLSDTTRSGSLGDMATVIAIAACLSAVGLGRAPVRVALGVAVGALVLVVFQSLGMATGSTGQWLVALATGTLLGASVVLAGEHRAAQIALAVAVLGAGRLGSGLDSLLQYREGPQFAWVALAPEDAVAPERAFVVVIATSLAAVALFVAYRRQVAEQRVTPSGVSIVGVALPIAAVVISRIAGGYRDDSIVWFIGLAGLTLAVVLASLALPGQDGRLVLVLFAAWAATAVALGTVGPVAQVEAFGDSYLHLVIAAGAGAVGALFGYLWPQIYIGLAGIVVIAAAGSAAGRLGDLPMTVAQYALLFVVGYLLVSVLPAAPTSLAVAVMVPFAVTLPVTVSSSSTQVAVAFEITDRFGAVEQVDTALPVAGLVVVFVVASVCAVQSWRKKQVHGSS